MGKLRLGKREIAVLYDLVDGQVMVGCDPGSWSPYEILVIKRLHEKLGEACDNVIN